MGALCWNADPAHAHGANLKAPRDDTKRRARPSPIAPAPPDVVTESARGLPAVWKPEGWYRWWELNAVALTPRRRTQTPAVRASVTTPAPKKAAAVPASDVELAKLVAALMRLADPEAKTERRLLASALVTLGRLAEDERPLFLLKRWAINRAAGAAIRNAALLGLGLLRRDEPSARIAAVHLRTLRRFLFERADDTASAARSLREALRINPCYTEAMLALANRNIGYAKIRNLLADRFQRDVLSDLEHRLSWVYTVIKSAPMVGLLGTVVGMMGAFSKLASSENAADVATRFVGTVQFPGGIRWDEERVSVRVTSRTEADERVLPVNKFFAST